MESIDQQQVQDRIDRISEIFSDIVVKAQKSAARRCPYKNRFSECTAKFKCGLQGGTVGDNGFLPCFGEDKFGYCRAWTNEPIESREA